jgi:hypothetical protein
MFELSAVTSSRFKPISRALSKVNLDRRTTLLSVGDFLHDDQQYLDS